MSEQALERRSGLHLRIFGLQVRIPLSGLLGVAIIAWLWAPTFGTDGSAFGAAIVFAALLYVGILAHELAHGLVARRLGHRVHGITLWILGGYTVYEREGLTAGKEAAIALSGPVTTLLYAGLAQVLLLFAGAGVPVEVVLVLQALVFTNVLLGVINLLPGLPLDGGGVVSAAVWAVTGNESRGTVVAAWAGRVLAVLVVAVPIAWAALPNSQVGLLTVVIAAVFGVFLWTGATAALRRVGLESKIPALQAGRLARRAVPATPQESLAIAQQRMSDAQAGAIVVQDDTGRAVGVVNEAAASATPLERRPWVPVSSFTTTVPVDGSVPIEMSGQSLIAELQRLRAPAVIVRDDAGAIYGVLFIDDVEQALR